MSFAGLAAIGAFARRCMLAASGVEHNTRTHLMAAGGILQREAQGAIGTYKYGWPRLDPATIARKKMGDTPLLETGAMRAGIQVQPVDAHTVDVVATDPKSGWHELGTSRIPPRPFMGPAAEATHDQVAKEVDKGLIVGLNAGF